MSEHQLDLSEHKTAMRRQESADAAAPSVADGTGAVHSLLRLQSQVGNTHIARLLAQREADAQADAAQATHDLTQRAGAEDEEPAQAKHDHSETVGVEGGAVGPDTTARIHGQRGGGSPLDEGTRTSMEAAFGTSFADVRVHTDHESDTLNRRLTARAFTTGNDIFLRRDSSPSDTRLIAHELTHVVQQRSMAGGGGMRVGAAGDPHERHADAVAEAVTSAPPAPASAGMAAQRAAAEEEEAQAQHDLAQRAEEEEETAQAKHDLAQRAGDEDEEQAQAKHDLAQRAEDDEEPAQAQHDLTQRGAEEEEPAQAQHDLAQRAEEEEEPAQAQHDLAQREADDEEAA